MIQIGCSLHPSHKHCSKQAKENKWQISPRRLNGATQWFTLHRLRYSWRCKMRPRLTWRPCILRTLCSRLLTLWRLRHPIRRVATMVHMSKVVSANTYCLSFARFSRRPRLTRVSIANCFMCCCSMCPTMRTCTTRSSCSRIRSIPRIHLKSVISLSCLWIHSTPRCSASSTRGIGLTNGSTTSRR